MLPDHRYTLPLAPVPLSRLCGRQKGGQLPSTLQLASFTFGLHFFSLAALHLRRRVRLKS